MVKNICKTILGGLLALCVVAGEASAVPLDYSGTKQTSVWSDLTAAGNPGYPEFPGTADWPGPISANVGTGVLNKVANGYVPPFPGMPGRGVFPAGSGLYFGGIGEIPGTLGATLEISSSSVLSGVETFVFQIESRTAYGFDLHGGAPVLRLNGTEVTLSDSAKLTLGTFYDPNTEDYEFSNRHYFLWDISGFGAAVTSFSLTFSGVEHSVMSGFQVDQLDGAYTIAEAIPEPSTWALVICGVLGSVAWGVRRKRA